LNHDIYEFILDSGTIANNNSNNENEVENVRRCIMLRKTVKASIKHEVENIKPEAGRFFRLSSVGSPKRSITIWHIRNVLFIQRSATLLINVTALHFVA
jgi:hypothetical protein